MKLCSCLYPGQLSNDFVCKKCGLPFLRPVGKSKLSRAKIKIAKKNLRKLQWDHGYSLRQMAAKLNNEISFQSLGRFISEKDYIPKSEEVCKLLDLYADPNPYRGLPKWYKRTPEALNFFNTKREQIRQMSDEAKRQRDSFAKG